MIRPGTVVTGPSFFRQPHYNCIVKVTFFLKRTARKTSNVYQSPKICVNARNRLRRVASPPPLLAPDMVWDEWSSTVKCNTSTNSASIGHRSASWTHGQLWLLKLLQMWLSSSHNESYKIFIYEFDYVLISKFCISFKAIKQWYD